MSNHIAESDEDLPVLPTGWTYRRLGDLVEKGELSYGIVQPGSRESDGVPLIRVKDLRKGHVVVDDVVMVGRDIETKHRRTRLRGGEVLLSLVGSVGMTARVPPSLAGWNVARAIAVIRPSGEVSGEWINLCLKSPAAQRAMEIWQTNTVQATLNLRDVRRIPIVSPPRGERIAITELVGALDDKIAVNERIADCARRLGIAMYQGSLEGGFEDHPIGDLSILIARGVAPSYTESEDALTVLNQKCIRSGRVNLAPARRVLRDRVNSLKFLQRNDVLVNSTGVGTLGRVARWTFPGECTVDSHVTIIRFDEVKVDPVCAGFAMFIAQPEIESMGEGSTGQTELNRVKLGRLRLRLPSKVVSDRLGADLAALEEKSDAALAESLRLAELRDTLLPKLMSGEIRVRDAEKVVEEAT